METALALMRSRGQGHAGNPIDEMSGQLENDSWNTGHGNMK